MANSENQLTEKESLALIATMINKAKNSYHETGVSAILWGIVIAACSLEKLAELQFHFRLPFDIYLLTLAAVIPQVFISIREKKGKRVKSYDDIYMDFIWLGFGISIFLMILITNNIYSHVEPMMKDYQLHAAGRTDWVDFRFSEYVSPLFLLLYGLPTFVTGASCKFKPMLLGGIFCWVCCIITVYTNIKIDLLLTALSALLAWLIPGIIMERDYRKAKQGLREANV